MDAEQQRRGIAALVEQVRYCLLVWQKDFLLAQLPLLVIDLPVAFNDNPIADCEDRLTAARGAITVDDQA